MQKNNLFWREDRRNKFAYVFSKQITDVLKTGAIEASTEWGQYGLEQANRVLAEKDGDVGETVGTTLKKMFTEQEALESALQGFVGGVGISR